MKWNTDIFIEKAKEIHGNKYDYSKVEYINSRGKINIICKQHGIFRQLPSNHIRGYKCPHCSLNYKKMGLKQFIKKAKEIHGNKYDYSKVEYINNHTRIAIICQNHGIYMQEPQNHIRGHGCPTCMVNTHIKNHSFNTDIFIQKAKEIHGNKYDYSKVEYINNHNKVRIICPFHGDFFQSFVSHINHKNECPSCKSSKSEIFITNWFVKNKIKFFIEKTFENCKNIRKLPFDFYLPEHNICIEYDGEQHFYPIDFSYGKLTKKEILENFNKIQTNDKIKNDFCKNNNIKLIRISYKNNIEEILKNVFN